jgi:hypothetical protein
VAERTRDLAMFNLAIDGKLRGSDVVAIKVEDVAPNGVRPVCVCCQWRKKPPGELSIAPVADERLGWATIWVGAS